MTSNVITNTTTYFFREARALRALADILPRPRAHVWIVGCSTGDEVYSLAILATEAGLSLDITASDISPTALATAAAASYRGRNLRLLDARRIEQYFDRTGDDTYVVRRDSLPNISWRFVRHDIANNPSLTPLNVTRFDAVICRHVLVYLDDAECLRALRTMTGSIRDRGHVLLAGSEWLGRHTRDESLAKRAQLELTLLTHRHDEEPVLVYKWHRDGVMPKGVTPLAAPKPLPTVVRQKPAAINPTTTTTESHWLACVAGDRALDVGDIERALANYQLADALSPDAPETQLRLGLAHMIAGDGRLAKRALEHVIARRSSWPALLLLGDLTAGQGGDTAMGYYRRALDELQRSSRVPAELGSLEAFWPDRTTLIDMLTHKIAPNTPKYGR